MLAFEIHDHVALTVLCRQAIPFGKSVVGSVSVYFANCRNQVVHVPFHFSEYFVFFAGFTATVLPALTLVTKGPCGHDVFPFDAVGPFLLFADFIAAAV